MGIPMEERAKIFEKFYRIGDESTRTTKGTGLGLYLCKKISEFHQATITVEEQPLPSLTLSSQAACADDLESYGLEITTEDGNIVTASLGTVTNNAGIVSITDITPEMPTTITITNPTTAAVI